MKVGDRVYCIPRKEFRHIDAVKRDMVSHEVVACFCSSPDGLGFWFRVEDLTEG